MRHHVYTMTLLRHGTTDPYELPDDELARLFWASVWGRLARDTARPDDPKERKNRDPLVHALLCKFIHTPRIAGGLGSVFAADDAGGLRELRAEIMATWPQEVKAT